MKSELRTQFQKLFIKKGEEVFNTMWNNVGVRNELWGSLSELTETNAKKKFYEWVNAPLPSSSSSQNFILYKFIQ